jgi:hypothetical protein
MKTRFALLILSALGAPLTAGAVDDDLTPSAGDARVYIISPIHGATLSSPVKVVFGLGAMGVAPAGVDKENTGHHHLLVDHPVPPLDEALTNEDGLLHFGGGQTETTITLDPGTHTLQLILGDQYHIPHNPPVISESITITVE